MALRSLEKVLAHTEQNGNAYFALKDSRRRNKEAQNAGVDTLYETRGP